MHIKRILSAVGLAAGLSMAASVAPAADIDKLHFPIPGGARGGWDGTARGTGEALTKAGIVGTASYENMSGGGGGKAIGYLIENAKSNHGTLMVNSTPIVIRSLVGRFPRNFRDLTMIAGTIGDYAAFVVSKDSQLKSFKDLVAAYKADPKKVAIGGGSVPGGMDHLVAAMAMQAAGADPNKVKYIPYDAGAKAMAALLSGEVQAISTGFSEAVAMAKAGEANIIGVTSAERVDAFNDSDDPALVEEGVTIYRERFAAKGLYENRVYDGIPELLARMTEAGHGLFLATSKVRLYAVEILRHFGLDSHFRGVYGAEMDGRLGEKPELLAHLLETEDLRPGESVMIGGRRHDMVGTRANGIAAIGVLYGFGDERELRSSGADHLCRVPGDIAAAVAALS